MSSEPGVIRIEASIRGETGYLRTETDLNFRIQRSVVFDVAQADAYPTMARAEKHLRLLQAADQRLFEALGRRDFDSVRIVVVPE